MSTDYTPEFFALLRARDEGAWRQLFADLSPKVYGCVLQFTRQQHHEAEEVVSHAFVRAYRAIDNFRGDSSLKTWLIEIARNLAINRFHYHRRRQRDAHLHLDLDVTGSGRTLTEVIADHGAGPIELNEQRELAAAITAHLPKLCPRYQEILALRIGGRSYEDIAALLALNVGTVKSRIARARHALRAIMDEEYFSAA